MSVPRLCLPKATFGSMPAFGSIEHLPLYESSEKTAHPLEFIPPSPKKSWIRSVKLPFILKLFSLSFMLILAWIFQETIVDSVSAYDVLVPNHRVHQQACSQDVDAKAPNFAGAPAIGDLISAADRAKWKPSCSSELTTNPCNLATDADTKTYWQTANGAQKPVEGGHWIQIDLINKVNVHSIAMTPTGDAEQGGAVSRHKVQISNDGKIWETVAFGTWYFDDEVKYATFEPRQARYVRLIAIESTNNAQFIAIADISVFVTKSVPAHAADGGKWGLTLNFPLVPVGVFVNPISGDVVTISSYKHNRFDNQRSNKTTFTATWDRSNGKITDKQIQETKHDMFCPGMSFDENGRMIITGGSTSQETSIYDAAKNEWSKGGTLNIGRGYQGQTFVPNGKTFLIGGSWNGIGRHNKNGELYDPATKQWKELSGTPGIGIEMGTEKDESRWDYHVWMFGWKNDSIFHAGPAKKMHWITTSEPGAITYAGVRGVDGTADGDAVCGITSMYDAENGYILTAGGAPQYHYWNARPGTVIPQGKNATNNSYIIQLGSPGVEVTVKSAGQMKHQRAFANAVTLPNGETFVVGGQAQGEPFYEETWHAVPEIYSPTTNTWREATEHSTPRTYHSFALLLPDATVLVGGGGLSRDETDHFDAQVYYPPYLLKADGASDATRPKINSVSPAPASVKVGDTITIKTDIAVDDASLVRFSGATHSLNNDQRRIKLTLVKDNGVNLQYMVKIPPDTGVALPGYWMLFVFANGVPSVSQTVQIRIK